ncbi:MAG: ABC transporter ATP-binding protein [Pelagibacteraceae bacterium]|jgi:ABC-type dipeptide/oligopeptide/nickel transport system ATPase component|nr:ABC transporter ATP-binding protein [Pelagibacteraceae bacterium]MBT3902275.1 ABC transporter ATP-binding protein [Pelagibacteraceae bacterium]MBT4646101.1 ABC transporter ATP-binding protein [Pelagibacteraceae bacterium]MBT4950435.1 ABC transporter ATP-binding protein [Pelagibacteraceae bacterium]MBT5214499.1 ABC transporter ATP-binding protein [Pelagibacteraceae bacterium]
MTILSIKNLEVKFKHFEGITTALKKISLNIKHGEKVALVGESGSGKSVTARMILGLLSNPNIKKSGEIFFENKDLLKESSSQIKKIRGNDISMIFQDPVSSMNPFFTVRKQMLQALENHNKNYDKKNIDEYFINLLRDVKIEDPQRVLNSYAFQLSGGMAQRVMISMAMINKPKLILADEPTTALDVTVQKTVLKIMKEIISQKKMSMLLISHNLGVVREFADRIYVIYQGSILEEGTTEQIFNSPGHIYTQTLLRAIPKINSSQLPSLNAENINYLSQPKFTH